MYLFTMPGVDMDRTLFFTDCLSPSGSSTYEVQAYRRRAVARAGVQGPRNAEDDVCSLVGASMRECHDAVPIGTPRFLKWVCAIGALTESLKPPKQTWRALCGLEDKEAAYLRSKQPGDLIYWPGVAMTTLNENLAMKYALHRLHERNNLLIIIREVDQGILLGGCALRPREEILLLPAFSILEVLEVDLESTPPKLICEFRKSLMSHDFRDECLRDLDEACQVLVGEAPVFIDKATAEVNDEQQLTRKFYDQPLTGNPLTGDLLRMIVDRLAALDKRNSDLEQGSRQIQDELNRRNLEIERLNAARRELQTRVNATAADPGRDEQYKRQLDALQRCNQEADAKLAEHRRNIQALEVERESLKASLHRATPHEGQAETLLGSLKRCREDFANSGVQVMKLRRDLDDEVEARRRDREDHTRIKRENEQRYLQKMEEQKRKTEKAIQRAEEVERWKRNCMVQICVCCFCLILALALSLILIAAYGGIFCDPCEPEEIIVFGPCIGNDTNGTNGTNGSNKSGCGNGSGAGARGAGGCDQGSGGGSSWTTEGENETTTSTKTTSAPMPSSTTTAPSWSPSSTSAAGGGGGGGEGGGGGLSLPLVCPMQDLGPGIDATYCSGLLIGETCLASCSAGYAGEAVVLSCLGLTGLEPVCRSTTTRTTSTTTSTTSVTASTTTVSSTTTITDSSTTTSSSTITSSTTTWTSSITSSTSSSTRTSSTTSTSSSTFTFTTTTFSSTTTTTPVATLCGCTSTCYPMSCGSACNAFVTYIKPSSRYGDVEATCRCSATCSSDGSYTSNFTASCTPAVPSSGSSMATKLIVGANNSTECNQTPR